MSTTKAKTSGDPSDFLRALRRTESHAEWLSVVRFGLAVLVADQPTLFTAIADEAAQHTVDGTAAGYRDRFALILTELGLVFELAPPARSG